MSLSSCCRVAIAALAMASCSVRPSDAGEAKKPVYGKAESYPKAKPVTGKADEFPIRKTDEEWKKQLSSAQYYILRQQGTERPFANKYFDNHDLGDYFCAADHNLLFHSTTKFESGTGWPSFWAPASDESVKVTMDSSAGMVRDELVCSKCGGHLGHRFSDGPPPTGLRYCMDSDAMTFEKAPK